MTFPKLCGRHNPKDCYHCALDAWGKEFVLKFEQEFPHPPWGKGFLGYFPKTPDPGCCSKFYECYDCDELFCEHGLFKDNPEAGDPNRTVNVIPWVKRCPECEARDPR